MRILHSAGRKYFHKIYLLLLLFTVTSLIVKINRQIYSSNHVIIPEIVRVKADQITKEKQVYSRWEDNLSFKKTKTQFLKEKEKQSIIECLNKNDRGQKINLENLKDFIRVWSSSSNIVCLSYFKMFDLIYEVKFKTNNLHMGKALKEKVKKWLKDDENLVNRAFNQVRRTSF